MTNAPAVFEGKQAEIARLDEDRRARSGRELAPRPASRRLAATAVWTGMLLAVLLALMQSPSHGADTSPISERQALAMFVVTFAKYVEWPTNALASPQSPVVIGIVGRTEIHDELKAVLAARPADARPIRLKLLGGDEREAASCHIVFVPSREARQADALCEALKERPVLTVGETEQFTRAGGMIALVRREDRLRPLINLAAARRSGLSLSSKLLAVSDVQRGLVATP